jgi:hypothetical protein
MIGEPLAHDNCIDRLPLHHLVLPLFGVPAVFSGRSKQEAPDQSDQQGGEGYQGRSDHRHLRYSEL